MLNLGRIILILWGLLGFTQANASSAVPSAPTNVTATGDNGRATVAFSPPSNDGGSPILGYTVTANPGNITATGTSSPIYVKVDAPFYPQQATYTFTVAATNANGTGPASAPSNSVTSVCSADTMRGNQVVCIPGNSPAPATITSVTPGDGQATVAFTPVSPLDSGGSPIVGYTVTASPGNASATGTISPIVVTGLTNGTTYTFTVWATNADQFGQASSPSNSVTLIDSPSPPGAVSVTPGDGTALVAFSAPSSNGGSPITRYTVTVNPGSISASGGTSPLKVSGLTNGTAYTATITATNAHGTSAPSAPSNRFVPGTVPGAPSIGNIVPGKGLAKVYFDTPASNGGSPITQYTVTVNPGGYSASGSDSPITIPGLANGAQYAAVVTATNAYGMGATSASKSFTTLTYDSPPGTPSGVTATGGNKQAVVSWTASNSGGPATSYTITASPDDHSGNPVVTTCQSSPCTVSSLTNGITYAVSVIAVNVLGSSSPGTTSVTPATVPAAPTEVTITLLGTAASISFANPSDNGGSPVTQYAVVVTPGNIESTCYGSPCLVPGKKLEVGVAYSAAVAATNAIGTGPSSSSSNYLVAFLQHGTYSWMVPVGVTSLQFTVIGGGGGGGGGKNNYPPSNLQGGFGGTAASVSSTLAVSPGSVLNLVVGGGGSAGEGSATGWPGYGGGGGGASSVNAGTTDQIIAGGGGGGGGGTYSRTYWKAFNGGNGGMGGVNNYGDGGNGAGAIMDCGGEGGARGSAGRGLTPGYIGNGGPGGSWIGGGYGIGTGRGGCGSMNQGNGGGGYGGGAAGDSDAGCGGGAGGSIGPEGSVFSTAPIFSDRSGPGNGGWLGTGAGYKATNGQDGAISITYTVR